MRDWANSIPHTLGQRLGHPLRPVECSDDRLGSVLYRLSDEETWEAIERVLWAATVAVYELELTGMRLDSTTRSGYHQGTAEGMMPRGHSKDHRPALPQLQLMAAAAAPSGHLIGADIHAGQWADDPLYTPLIQRVRDIVGRTGLGSAGDCKLAAVATRAEMAVHHDFSLVPLPLTGDTAEEYEPWVTAGVDGPQEATLLGAGEPLLGAGYAFGRPWTAMVHGQQAYWTERVQGIRSRALAQRQEARLEKYLGAAEAALSALPPAPGRGKRQIRDAVAWQAAGAAVLERYAVAGLLTARWERHKTTVSRYVGRGRGGLHRPTHTEVRVRYILTSVERHEPAIVARRPRLGWRVQGTSAPAD